MVILGLKKNKLRSVSASGLCQGVIKRKLKPAQSLKQQKCVTVPLLTDCTVYRCVRPFDLNCQGRESAFQLVKIQAVFHAMKDAKHLEN